MEILEVVKVYNVDISGLKTQPLRYWQSRSW